MDIPPDESVAECARCREWEARVLELETKLRDLEDRLKALTKPPTKRPVEPPPAAPGKTPTGKKRGAQPGHKPHLKKWLPRERVSAVVPFVPDRCGACDAALPAVAGPNDPPPTIHQVAELPPLLATVTEYQGHARTCACGHVTHAAIPAAIRGHTLGPHLSAAVAYFAGSHGMSKRGIEEVVETLFGVPIAVGTIANVEREMSAALEPAYREARRHVADAAVKHLDETGWKEAGKKRWLWVAATTSAVLFLIHPRRNLDALKLLLGQLSGILVSDRWTVYDDWDEECRQVCWAHVKRNWDKQIERGGTAKALGDRWQATQKTVFEVWHLFRGGGCNRTELSDRLVPHAEALAEVLHAGTRTRDAVLARHCERLLERFPMLWLFASVDGVEPTNNHAERVQRRAVLWRRKSFGCQSPAGCRFVERILTVVQTLRLQHRHTLEFLGRSLAAHRQNRPTPLLCGAG